MKSSLVVQLSNDTFKFKITFQLIVNVNLATLKHGIHFHHSTNQPVHSKYFRLSLRLVILHRRHFSFYVFSYLHMAFRNDNNYNYKLSSTDPWRTVRVDWLICAVIDVLPLNTIFLFNGSLKMFLIRTEI